MTRVKEHKTFYFSMLIMSFFISILSGCSGGTGGGNWNDPGSAGADITRPTVILTVPITGATVPTNAKITAKFSEAMAPATITAASFTVRPSGPPLGVAVAGTVTYNVATMTTTFTPPVANFAPNTPYTATITVQATDLAGNAMAVNKVWTFTTAAGADSTAPLVTSTLPADLATDVSVTTKTITATFDEPMDPALFDGTSFTLQTTGPPLGAVIAGAYSYDALTNTVTFAPTANLIAGKLYTATVTSAVTDLAGNSLVVPAAGVPNNPWTFTTAFVVPPGNINDLMSYGIASFGGITNSGATKINGNVILNPNALCNTTPILFADGPGFGVCGGNILNIPTVNVGDLVVTPTYPDLTTAPPVTAALTAKWNSISPAILPGATPLGCGTIGSTGGCPGISSNLAPGTYISSTGSSIDISGVLTLTGTASDVWVFQAPSSTLITAVNSSIVMAGGAKASNVWWYVGSSATLNGGTIFNGNILASASISMGTSATSCGRLLAGAEGSGAFTFLSNTVSVPGHPNAPVGCQ